MFGTWISDVQRALLADFPPDSPYGVEDLKSPHMPTAVGHFLGHALKRRAARIEFSVESEWFDAEAPDVRSAVKAYRQALTQTARYPESVWQTSLERAVQIVVTYLANPAAGLVNFVFGESSEPISIPLIRERLDFFGSVTPLRDLIVRELERMDTDLIGPDDLRAVVLKADRGLVQDFEPDNWAQHLGPLFEIAVSLVEDEKEEAALPTDLLKAYFQVKGCDDIVRRLDAVESVKGVHTLTVDVLRRAVSEVQEPPKEESMPEQATDAVVTRVVRNDIHREEKPTVVPRWMQFAGGGKSPEPDQTAASPLHVDDPASVDDEGPGALSDDDFTVKIGQRAPVPDDLRVGTSGDGVGIQDAGSRDVPNEGGSVPRWTKFREANRPPTSPGPTNPSANLPSSEEQVVGRLNAVQRAWYVNHLFESDQARWSTVIELLAQADDWSEASEIIATEVFDRHGVDIYSKPAVDFTNAVEARFR